MASFLYFAYGSNLLTGRLRARCPSARPVGPAAADNWTVSFAKRGTDGSGKAMLEEGHQGAPGVVFEIDRADLTALDAAEGAGYRREDKFKVTLGDVAEDIITATYLPNADYIDRALLPYDWYHGLILAGAVEHALPGGHINWLQQAAVRADPEIDRPSRRHAIELLRQTGFAQRAEIRLNSNP